MIRLNRNSIIYLLCPSGAAAGGIESMHQLCDALRRLNYSAFMFYVPVNKPQPIHITYKKYDIAVATNIIDSKENVLIVPEVETAYLNRFERIQKVIDWLSVDNYFVSIKLAAGQKKGLRFFTKLLLGYNSMFDVKNPKKNIIHFAQSAYAKFFLASYGINSTYMPDYIHEEFKKSARPRIADERKDTILYNPVKGFEITKQLIDAGTHLKFEPLENFTPIQVAEKLATSKVYIDFGNHPGKDRFPREAALMGCCIVTGTRGSANFEEDVAIPNQYKFEQVDIEKIITVISDCIENYETRINDFSNYIKFIESHRQDLEHQIKSTFIIE